MNTYKNQLIGIVYGDCHVNENSHSKKARLDIYHTDKNLDLLQHKQRILNQNGLYCRIKEKIDKRPLKNGNTRRGFRLQTNFCESLYELNHIPFNQLSDRLVTPESLAILWQDDGTVCWKNKKYFSTATLAIDDWSQEYMKELQEAWHRAYGWHPKEQDYLCRGVHYNRLRLVKNQVEKLTEIIQDHVVDSMKYKLILKKEKDAK